MVLCVRKEYGHSKKRLLIPKDPLSIFLFLKDYWDLSYVENASERRWLL